MKRVLCLIMVTVTLLTLTSCGRTADNNIKQNVPNSIPKTEGVQSMANQPISAPHETDERNNLETEPKNEASATLESGDGADENGMTIINITVGSSVFPAKLYDNDTAKAFLAQLPLTLDMDELNGNEKYYYLADKLPTDSERIGSINTGDLMLYGSDCLVLFYESFSTTYSYTRLGFIDDAAGLADALGSGGVEVSFANSN